MRFYGVCNHNPETTVWGHANGLAAGKGMGKKSPDPLGAYLCSACHDLYDRRTPMPQGQCTWSDVEAAFMRAHQRSFLKLIEKGLVSWG